MFPQGSESFDLTSFREDNSLGEKHVSDRRNPTGPLRSSMVQIKNVLFGKLAVSTRFITEEQLQECLDYQKEIEERGERPPRLGEILEQKGYLTKQQIQSILETMSSMQRRRFGEIAVAFHFITLEQLETCLDIQKLLQAPQETVPLFGQALVTYRGFLKQVLAGGAHPKIGDVLVQMGYMRNHQVEAVLEEQNKRIVRCKSCEASLNISRFEPGQKIKCGQCNAVLEIVKPEGSEELDVALPTETKTQDLTAAAMEAVAGEGAEEQPMDPATAMMELDKEIARVRATQQFTPKAKTPGKIADFQVVTRLGQDATGVIFKASQISKNRPVALKIMNPSVMNDAGFQKKFIEEAKKVAGLEHPNIKKVYSLGKSDSRFYIAMEFVEAESVYNVLEKQGKFHFETAIGIALSISEALQYAQSQGVIHGDMRPSNVLILRDGSVKVANLGLATKVSENILAISRSGQMAPFYIAPECVTGDREMDQRTDIYSLGATLFHMIAGRPPFQGQSPFEVLVRLTEETIPPLKFFDPGIPDSVCRVVEKMLEAEPQDRYQTWDELINELRAVQTATGGAPSAVPGAAPGGIAVLPPGGGVTKVRTADDAKRAYEKRAARAATLRTLRQGAVAVLVLGGIAGGLLYWMNYSAKKEVADKWEGVKRRTGNVPVTAGDFTTAESLLQGFIDENGNSAEASEASDQIAIVRRQRPLAKANELKKIQEDVRKYLETKQFKAAWDTLGHGNTSFWPRESPEIKQLEPLINESAAADWAAVKEAALKLANDGQPQKAKTLVDDAKARRELPADVAETQSLYAEIDKIAKAKKDDIAAQEAKERLEKSLALFETTTSREVRPAMAKWQVQAAVAKLVTLRSAVHPNHIELVEAWRDRTQWMSELQSATVQAVREIINDFNMKHGIDHRTVMKFNGIEYRAIDINDTTVTFQDPKAATPPQPVAWGDLSNDALVDILTAGLAQNSGKSYMHYAFGEGMVFKAEQATDIGTKIKLMTLAEREFKYAADGGQAQAGPRCEEVSKFFTESKKDQLAAAKAALDAKKPVEARSAIRSLLNLFPGRLDDVQKDIDDAFSASYSTGGLGRYFGFSGGAVPAGLKKSDNWSVLRGIATASGKDEWLTVEGKVTEFGIVFRVPDDQTTITIELEGATFTYNADKDIMTVKYWNPREADGKRGSLIQQQKPTKPASLAARTWHSIELREVPSGDGSGTTMELSIDGTPVAVNPKIVNIGTPITGVQLKVNGPSPTKEGRLDIMGLFVRTK